MNILMISESNFPSDIRVSQEALTLMACGHRIAAIAIQGRSEKLHEDWKGVHIYRIPKVELFRRGKQTKAKPENGWIQRLSVVAKAAIGYGFEYFYFTSAGFILSLWICLRHRIDVVHTHNPPDTLFLIAGFYKMIGKKFVYDHHDLSPDLFLTKYGENRKIIYRFLLLLERVSCRTADYIIATNESYKRIEMERCGVPENKVFVVRNGPDLNIMKIVDPDEAIRNMAKTILCYLGAINVQDGVDNLLKVMHKIVHHLGKKDVCLLIIGEGDFFYEIQRLTSHMNLQQNVILTGHVADRGRINTLLSSADIFVDSAPQTFLNDHSTFIKNTEYLIFGKPIVSYALRESINTLQDAGVFVTPGDTEEFARTIVELIRDEKRRERLGRLARERVLSLSWKQVSKPLIALYEELLHDTI